MWRCGSLLDRFHRRIALSRSLSSWIRFVHRRCALQVSASIVERKIGIARKKVIWKDWFRFGTTLPVILESVNAFQNFPSSAWKFESLRKRGENSLKLTALLACRRLRYSRVVQRMSQQSALLFLHRKALLSCLLLLIRRINRACFAFTSGDRSGSLHTNKFVY